MTVFSVLDTIPKTWFSASHHKHAKEIWFLQTILTETMFSFTTFTLMEMRIFLQIFPKVEEHKHEVGFAFLCVWEKSFME